MVLPPKSGKMKNSGAASKVNLTATEVKVQELKTPKTLIDYINNDGVFASQDTDKNKWKGYTGFHKFTVNKPG